jgi:hypothetical protein
MIRNFLSQLSRQIRSGFGAASIFAPKPALLIPAMRTPGSAAKKSAPFSAISSRISSNVVSAAVTFALIQPISPASSAIVVIVAILCSGAYCGPVRISRPVAKAVQNGIGHRPPSDQRHLDASKCGRERVDLQFIHFSNVFF